MKSYKYFVWGWVNFPLNFILAMILLKNLCLKSTFPGMPDLTVANIILLAVTLIFLFFSLIFIFSERINNRAFERKFKASYLWLFSLLFIMLQIFGNIFLTLFVFDGFMDTMGG